MHATTHTNALTWRQRIALGAVLSLLLGCATAIGIGAYLLHERDASGITPVAPPMPVAPAPNAPAPLPPIVIPGDA